MVLSIGPSSLNVDPAAFEPNRPIVRERLFNSLEKEKHPNIDTRAYCVLEHSGWGEFVDGETFQSAKIALGRLLVNDDNEGARALLSELVDKL